ncbi:MAG: SagB family peptide dehydrogenase [Lactococcus lactis]|nr:SagB family peptide dehydrogenase [Lactococcus lactis]
MEYIVSNNCIFFEKDEQFVIDNFVLQEQKVLKQEYLPLLIIFSKPISYSDAIKKAEEYGISFEDADTVIDQLIKAQVLEEYGRKITAVNWTVDSLPMAVRYFYYNSKTNDKSYYEGSVSELLTLSNKKENKPNTFKEYPYNQQISLTLPDEGDSELLTTILNRRTIRNTDPNKKITLQEISELLYFSLGLTGQTFDSSMGNVTFRTVPTPGGRASIESYVVNNSINNGIPVGVFHYNSRKNKLELISEVNMKNKIVQFTGGQLHTQSSSLFILFTSRIDRMVWKYQESVALMASFIELGSIIQNQYLIADKLNIGACFIGAKRDTMFEDLLHLDKKVENFLGIMSLGKLVTDPMTKTDNVSRFYRTDLERLREEYNDGNEGV